MTVPEEQVHHLPFLLVQLVRVIGGSWCCPECGCLCQPEEQNCIACAITVLRIEAQREQHAWPCPKFYETVNVRWPDTPPAGDCTCQPKEKT